MAPFRMTMLDDALRGLPDHAVLIPLRRMLREERPHDISQVIALLDATARDAFAEADSLGALHDLGWEEMRDLGNALRALADRLRHAAA